MNATTYGVDTAKNVFQVHWVDTDTGEIGRKKIKRAKFVEFFAQLQPAVVAMEACGGSHHWARTLGRLGHDVQLLPAAQVRAFVRGNKDDAADARAIWLAAKQCDIRRVPVKDEQQQAVLSLHRTRSHWVSVRTATINALRGLLVEFGVALPQGKKAGLSALAEQRAQLDAVLPVIMVNLVNEQLRALAELDHNVAVMDAQIALMQKAMTSATRLRQVPGLGVLGATATAAVLGDGKAWRSGREFSASLGLVPGHTGTGGKVRMGRITKRGDPYLRTLMICGARAVMQGTKHPAWIDAMLLRRPFNVVVVAVANKMARTAWALVAHARPYEAAWASRLPTTQEKQSLAAGA